MSSEEEVIDDSLHIKPPQPRSSSSSGVGRHNKDRRGGGGDRSHHHHRHHKHGKSSKGGGDIIIGNYEGGGDRERSSSRHGGGGRHHNRDRERELMMMERERVSTSTKHASTSRSSGGGGRRDRERDVLLSEVKKERRNVEVEHERALREIEKRREREKEKGEDPYYAERRERKRDRRDRDKDKDKEHRRHRRSRHKSEEEGEEMEEGEEEGEVEGAEDEKNKGKEKERLIDDRFHLEVQDIEDSGSELEEGEHSRSSHSKEEEGRRGAASDRSDVSSASEHQEEENKRKEAERQAAGAASDGSSRSRSSKKSGEGRSGGSSSSSSSSSSSDSGSDTEQERNGEKEREDDDGPRPSKIPRPEQANTPPATPGKDRYNNMEKEPSSVKPASEDSRDIPAIVISHEENEEDLLPPYYPALQGCRRVEEFHLLNRIEEGTYGVVYRAKEKRTDEIVALKRLKMEKEKDGFPITSLREINTLLKAQHENIVTVREIVVGSNTDKIFLVMDYVEHDLKSLMETLKQKGQVFLPEEVKCLMIQLLRAVAHMHDNWILHRDLKTSNLLLSHKGILKVGDFGLAREYGSPLKQYTPIVVTLWYRAPELLLGAKEYSTPIDVWSVGCIFGELLKMEPMFPGKSEANELNLIFQSLGTPNDRIWPGYSKLPLLQKMTFADYPVNKLKTRFGHLTDKGIDLMNKFLTFNPAKRITAEDALEHSFFKELPLPIDPSMFPTWPAKSELGHKKVVASPKPPSGGQQFKGLKDDDDSSGFFLGGGDQRRQPVGAGFSLKF